MSRRETRNISAQKFYSCSISVKRNFILFKLTVFVCTRLITQYLLKSFEIDVYNSNFSLATGDM